MKATLLTFFLILVIFQIKAQQISLVSDPIAKPSESAMKALNWEDQKLRSDLTLSEGQFSKIKEITAERASARRIVSEMFKHEPNKLKARLQEIDSQFDGEFEEVLNAKQFKKYLKLEGRDKAVAKGVIPESKPADPNFNAQVQAMIAKVRKPAINPALIPKQDTLASENGLASDSLQNIVPAGLDPLEKQISPSSLVTREEEKPVQTEKQEISLVLPETDKTSQDKNITGSNADPGKSQESLNSLPELKNGD